MTVEGQPLNDVEKRLVREAGERRDRMRAEGSQCCMNCAHRLDYTDNPDLAKHYTRCGWLQAHAIPEALQQRLSGKMPLVNLMSGTSCPTYAEQK